MRLQQNEKKEIIFELFSVGVKDENVKYQVL